MYVYLNDKVVPKQEAVVSVYDHGFLYGDGIYETMRVYGGVVFMLDEHMKRLCRSAERISLCLPMPVDVIKAAVYETLKANDLSDASVRVSVTRGFGELGLDPDLCAKPTFVIYAHPFNSYPEEYFENGVKVMISKVRRNHPETLDPAIKSHNFLNNILAKIEAKRGDYFEAIMRNLEGQIAEGTISNLFFIKHDTLCTPHLKTGILDGITREIIIRLAMSLGMNVREDKFRPGDLQTADEAFISNSLMEIMPVTHVGDEIIAGGHVGHRTKELLAAYRNSVAEYVAERASKGEH